MRNIIACAFCLNLMSAMLSYAGDLKAESSVVQMLISVRSISGVQSLQPVTGGIPLVFDIICDSSDGRSNSDDAHMS